MIRLTRLNGCPFFLNSDLIEFIEATPDTVVTMLNGGKVLAKESPEEVVNRVIEFRRRITVKSCEETASQRLMSLPA